jgi:hypothetical protein
MRNQGTLSAASVNAAAVEHLGAILRRHVAVGVGAVAPVGFPSRTNITVVTARSHTGSRTCST